MSNYKDYGYHNATATHAHQYIVEHVLKMISSDVNKYILDLGCGNGVLVNQLISLGFNAYGTDASETGILQAEKINPGRFAIQDLNNDNLPEQLLNIPFDTIIATEVIEHLYDPKGFIQFCKNILQKNNGGKLIISTPYHGYLKNLMLSLFGKWDAHANPLWDGGHIKLWSRDTITTLLEEAGFELTTFKGCGRFPYLWKSMLIEARLIEHE